MTNYKKLLILPLLAAALPAFAETPPAVIGLNNQGVTALNKKDYETAIAKFEEALAGDPLYSLARDNMGIACNNKGLTLEGDPQQAIKWFERALFYSSTNKTTEANLDGIIHRLGLDPGSFDDRVKLGDQAFNEKRIYGAVVEYRAALNIKPDPDIGAKLAAALKEDFSPIAGAVPNSDPQKAAKIKEIETLLDAQKWSDASPLLDAMVKQHPGDAVAWYNLGICRQAAGDFPAALACYGMAKTLRPKDPEIQKAFDAVMAPK